MVKLIVFDWDDVFTLGSREGYIACYHQAAKEVGVEIDPVLERERILAKWGRPHRDEVAELLQEYPERVDEASLAWERLILSDTFTDQLTLLDGAVDFLNELSKEYVLTVATGLNPVVMKERVFPKFAIPPVFTQIVTAYDLADRNRGKPYPDMVLAILKEQGCSPDEAIMVGDAPGDMRMGKAAGVRTVAVLTGLLDREAAQEIGADYIIENVVQLKELLLRL
jgi:phosphoglycolate phosphatase-like HAD superfamily hydrolase